MAKLSSLGRKQMAPSKFALPASKRFPDEDAKHQRLAISGASRSERAGNISAATASRIKARERNKLGIAKGMKGKPPARPATLRSLAGL
jgi:hypothetical protein